MAKDVVQDPIEVFFSYAHEDEALMDRVRQQLVVHERLRRIKKWHDRKIPPGDEWRDEINEGLKRARIVLLFMSPAFLASDYCYEKEGKLALERHNSGEAHVIPVVLRPCAWRESPFGELQAVPKDGHAVILWEHLDEATNDAAEGIMRAVEKLLRPVDAKGEPNPAPPLPEVGRPSTSPSSLPDIDGPSATPPPAQQHSQDFIRIVVAVTACVVIAFITNAVAGIATEVASADDELLRFALKSLSPVVVFAPFLYGIFKIIRLLLEGGRAR